MEMREQWTAELSCSDCGSVGTAVVSEEDHPYETGDVGRRVLFCSPGFQILPRAAGSADTRIECATCKNVVFVRNGRDSG
jgi:hypothetical protein